MQNVLKYGILALLHVAAVWSHAAMLANLSQDFPTIKARSNLMSALIKRRCVLGSGVQ